MYVFDRKALITLFPCQIRCNNFRADKYAIDIKALDMFGVTPFDRMLTWEYNYHRRLIIKKLDC